MNPHTSQEVQMIAHGLRRAGATADYSRTDQVVEIHIPSAGVHRQYRSDQALQVLEDAAVAAELLEVAIGDALLVDAIEQ